MRVFIVTRIGASHNDTEILMAFKDIKDAEYFQAKVSDWRTLCLNGDTPKPNQYMWSDRFRISEASLY